MRRVFASVWRQNPHGTPRTKFVANLRPNNDILVLAKYLVLVFTARRSYASAVLVIVILSVCPSLCHTRALWRNERTYCLYFDITVNHEHFSFMIGDHSFSLKFALKVTLLKNADFNQYLLIVRQSGRGTVHSRPHKIFLHFHDLWTVLNKIRGCRLVTFEHFL